MKRLTFKVAERIFFYSCTDYKLEDEFYNFVDIRTGLQKKMHKSLLIAEEEEATRRENYA